MSDAVRRPRSDFMDMLRRLINYRIIIIIYPTKRQENQVVYSTVHQWLLQSPAVSASGVAFCRRAHGYTTAAEQQQQQRGRRRGRDQSGACASSD